MKKIFVALLILLLFFAIPAVFVHGNGKRVSLKRKIVTLPSDEVVDKDYFAAAEIVEIYGTVNGDVYAAGGQVVVNGKINGDLLAAGGDIAISGDVSQDVRAAGGQINIIGKVGRNITIGGGNIVLADSAKIDGSVVVGGGNVNLAAPIGGNATIGAGNLTVANEILGDLEAGVGAMRLTSKAKILGSLTYWSDADASIDKEATISGKLTKKLPPKPPKPKVEKAAKRFTKLVFFGKIIGFISTLIIGLLMIYFFPKYIQASVETLKKKPWASLGTGFLALILTPIIIVSLLITVIGIPAALIILPLYAIGLYLANIYVICWLGQTIFQNLEKKNKHRLVFVLGLVVYFLLSLVPVVRRFIGFFALLFGLGASLLAKKELYLEARKKELL